MQCTLLTDTGAAIAARLAKRSLHDTRSHANLPCMLATYLLRQWTLLPWSHRQSPLSQQTASGMRRPPCWCYSLPPAAWWWCHSAHCQTPQPGRRSASWGSRLLQQAPGQSDWHRHTPQQSCASAPLKQGQSCSRTSSAATHAVSDMLCDPVLGCLPALQSQYSLTSSQSIAVVQSWSWALQHTQRSSLLSRVKGNGHSDSLLWCQLEGGLVQRKGQ